MIIMLFVTSAACRQYAVVYDMCRYVKVEDFSGLVNQVSLIMTITFKPIGKDIITCLF